MTADTLFELPDSEPSALDRARARFAAAQDQYDQCSAWEDESGEEVPHDVRREMAMARRALMIQEERAIERMRP